MYVYDFGWKKLKNLIHRKKKRKKLKRKTRALYFGIYFNFNFAQSVCAIIPTILQSTFFFRFVETEKEKQL